jgi:hypothetical protein
VADESKKDFVFKNLYLVSRKNSFKILMITNAIWVSRIGDLLALMAYVVRECVWYCCSGCGCGLKKVVL